MFDMYRTLLLAVLVVTAATAAELSVFEGRLGHEAVQSSLNDMQVVFESVDFFVAFTPEGMLDAEMDRTVLDSGDISPEDYVLVHLSSPEGEAHLAELGEAVLLRDRVAIVRLSRPVPDPFVREGVFFVQPLRVMRVELREPFQHEWSRGYDDDVADIVAAVSEDSIKYFIQHLEDYQTRHSSTDNYDTACDWVEMKFESYGLEAEQQVFSMPSYNCQNVIAELPGVTDSTKIWIICGHLDSTSGSPYTNAPGADDNASGSTAVIEAARVLSGYEFEYTLRFICFGGEEQGLYGSAYYASQASSAGDDILGVINLDMVLYGPPGQDVLWVPYNTPSEGLALAMEAISDTYVPALTVDIEYAPGITYSDHASFWNNGYAAVLAIEQEVWNNPYYHSTSDLLANYLQYFPFGTNSIKAAIASIAYLAEPAGQTGVSEGGAAPVDLRISGLSPNPVQSILTVTLSAGSAGAVDVALYDITGRAVMAESRDPVDGALTMDLSDLPAGVYVLRASSGSMSHAGSVVVTR